LDNDTNVRAALGGLDWRHTVAICLCSALPVFLVPFPPLHDYPFHLARFDILARYGGSDFLQRIYNAPNYLLPNVATDVLAVALAGIMPIRLAGHVLVAFIVFLQVSGVCALHYAIWRRLSAWPFVAVLLVYNFILLFGFLNYELGVGLALWGVALRVALLSRPVWVRFVAGCAVTLLIYFAHIAALGLYALLLGSLWMVELLRGARENRAWRSMRVTVVETLTLALPVVLFLGSPTVQSGEPNFLHALQVGWLWFVESKLSSVVSVVSFGNLWLDLAHVATWTAVLGAIARLARPRFHPSLWLFLAAGVSLFLVTPHAALTGWDVDARIPIFLALSAVAFVDLKPTDAPAFNRLTTVLTAAALVRTFAVAVAWYSSQGPLTEVVDALWTLPSGSVVFTASADAVPAINRFWHRNWTPPMKHVVSYAGLERDVFVPATWAHSVQQPISVRREFRRAYVAQGNNPPEVGDAEQLAQAAAWFREAIASEPVYLLLLGDETPVLAVADAHEVARGQRFSLLALR
jgi:hypothetical protein